jgi:hypothetical protein
MTGTLNPGLTNTEGIDFLLMISVCDYKQILNYQIYLNMDYLIGNNWSYFMC